MTPASPLGEDACAPWPRPSDDHAPADRRREFEDVGLQVRDARVRLDDLAQRVALLHDAQLVGIPRLVQVEEAVAGCGAG